MHSGTRPESWGRTPIRDVWGPGYRRSAGWLPGTCIPRGQEAVSEAQSLAASRGHSVIEPAHLLAALLGQPEGSTIPILQKLGVSVDGLQQGIEALLGSLPNACSTPPSARPRP
jgi:hypothetical protein